MTSTPTLRTESSNPSKSPADLPRLGPGGAVRFLWAQLTSMRTALVLLFALAVAAVPGSLLPQRSVTPIRVDDYIDAHPRLGPIYDAIGLFGVYRSPWFAAVYLLLFVSLVGCIIPRVLVYSRALRAQPPRTPRHLSRLPAYDVRTLEGGEDVLERAAATLRARRYRVTEHGDSVAAERGYLREAGNLVFHLALLALLAGVAVNGLYGFRGTSVVVVGQGFSNTLTQYDDLTAGGWFEADRLDPFTVQLDSFDVKFETGPVQRGAARLFRAQLRLTESVGAAPVSTTLEVNHPLTIRGTTVHLIGHGYAPVFTVRDGNGDVAFSGPVVFLPQDGNFTSAGVVKAPDGRPQRLAFQGIFLPTAVTTGANAAPTSAFPDALNPTVLFDAWVGPPKVETGRPESVYSLDTTGMTQVKKAGAATPVRFALQPGDKYTLPNGLGSITMDGWERWVKLQVSSAPGLLVALASIIFAIAGLSLSLFIRPRRVWVRLRTSEDGTRVVEVGGLDRADARAGLAEDVAELAEGLAHPPAPGTGSTGTGSG